MLFLTRSSFLYPYNNWDDSNSYFTMGKSMFHGILIYRDLFDQKGPYLYFLYGLCSLLSRTTFRGVFLMEVIFGAFDLALLRRILNLFCSVKTAFLLSPVIFTCMCASKSFYWGGCAEELCLPFLLMTFYLLLRRLQEASAGKNSFYTSIFSSMDLFLAGLCCGIVFNIKFTLMGFFLGFAIIVIAGCRSVREFFGLAGWFLLGIAVTFIPWLIYFGIRGGLDDWYRVYIYTNVFRYSNFGANSHGETASSRIYDLAKILYWLVRDNIQYFLFIIAGLLWLLVRPAHAEGRLQRRALFLMRIAPVLMFLLTFLFIYIGGAHLPYYSFPLTTFAVTGMAFVGYLMDIAASRLNCFPHKGLVSRICHVIIPAALSLALSFLIYWNFSWNRSFLGVPKSEVFLSKFTDDINNDRAAGLVNAGNTTLLNVGCLDCGLYTTADIYPNCYWFQTQTLPGSEVTDAQYSYIAGGLTDYVVARDSIPDNISEHYELIDTFHQASGTGYEFDYYLFRLITDS